MVVVVSRTPHSNAQELNNWIIKKLDTQSLCGTNGESIGNGKIPAEEVDLDISKGLDVLELILLMGDLATKNFSLLYILLLNNALEIILLFFDDLADAN